MRNILIQSKIIMILDEIGLSIIAGQRQAERTVLTRRGVSRILADFFVCPHYHYADFLLLSIVLYVPLSEANNPVKPSACFIPVLRLLSLRRQCRLTPGSVAATPPFFNRRIRENPPRGLVAEA